MITCMIYKSEDLELLDISKNTYNFTKFDEKHLEESIASDECIGKAGSIMIENSVNHI